MAFEVYRPRSSNENLVSITKHHIRLGNKMADKFNGAQVEVAYDKDTNKLRIRSVDDGGMKITNNKIGARGIFKYFNLEGLKGNYPVELDENDNAIYVNLNSKRQDY